ncbi:GTP pyrophosphokinase [Rhodobacter capsulatus]|uniref:GTP pyrophosphokinase n=1 Tax=Rhodobacter capsulatus TaxID=1061 RepID=UPI00402891EB
MTNREEDFLSKWRSEKAHYQRWGDYVAQSIHVLISGKLSRQENYNFIRVPIEPRLKGEESLLQKAFHRNKNYDDPYGQIEDKVGLRVIVLLEADTRLVESLVMANDKWFAVKARDYEEEIETKPYEFGYQSRHLVVRSKGAQEYSDQDIPEGLPCEIQIRTLLQHAHSELTHDTLYKSNIKATSRMRRESAKSMALLEATGDYFDKLASLISEQVAPLRALDDAVQALYLDLVGAAPAGVETPLNDQLLDRYGPGVDLNALSAWLLDNEFIGKKIAARLGQRIWFRLPSILLVYYAVGTAERTAKRGTPIPDDDLEFVYSDLGKSLF